MQQRADKTKDEILKRMQSDTLEVISNFSETEFERKNKVALLCENLSREQKYFWKKVSQNLESSRGAWRYIGSKYLRSKLVRTAEGVRSYMSDRNQNGFVYIKDDAELEKKIFKVVDNKEHHISDFGNDIPATMAAAATAILV